jgi:hypothetical protein
MTFQGAGEIVTGDRLKSRSKGGGGAKARTVTSRARALDAYGLLKTMLDNWQTVFGTDLNRAGAPRC